MMWRMGVTGAISVLCLCLTSQSVSAQGLNGNSFQNWNFLGGGARARGMGGAYLGVSNDGHAASWNPAGLVYNEGVLTTLNYSFTRLGQDLNYGPAGQDQLSNNGNANLSNLSSAAFVSPLAVMEKEFIVSVFYNRLQDVHNRSFFAVDADPALGAPFKVDYSLKGNVSQAGVGFGTVIKGRLSLGATLSLITGDGIERLRTDIDSTRDTSAYNQSLTWINSADLDYSGLSATIGALYKAERWTAGVTFSPGYALTQAVDFFAQRRSVHNQVVDLSRPVLGPLHGSQREIDVPYTVGLGGSYQLSDNLLLAADYQYRAFNADDKQINEGISNYRIQASPSEPNSAFEEVPVAWYNLHQIRVGMEYKRETSWGVVPMRIGFRNEPMLMGDPSGTNIVLEQRLESQDAVEFPYYSILSTPDGSGSQLMGWTIALGSGIHWSQVRLDAALELTSFTFVESGSVTSIQRCPDCIITDPTVTDDFWGKRKNYAWGNFVREQDNSTLRFLVNFTGYF